MKRILTIAGSDSGGGAGIQADLKTITLLGGFGMSVITALTAQNTTGVQGIYPVPLEFIEEQMDSVLSDIGVDAVKTGMLLDSQVIQVVAKKIAEYKVEKLIVDPVMVAKDGHSLLSKDALDSLRDELIPISFLITPNLPEASAICGRKIESLDDMKKASIDIRKYGARNVLIKGGHFKGSPIDVLFDGERFIEYGSPRITTENTHGTGCVYSAVLACEVAQGSHIHEAVKNAKEFITCAIKNSLHIGRGYGPVNPYSCFSKEVLRYHVICQIKDAVRALKGRKIGHLIPEVQSNLAMALPNADTVEDVAAIPGRIIRLRDTITTVSDPEFGASQHIARIILTMMQFNGEMRSAMNIAYSEDTIKKCPDLGLNARFFDRRKEPEYSKKEEGVSLKWVVENVMKGKEEIPDVIYDTGDVGKEPMIRIVGKDAQDVVEKVLRIAGRT
ncbi:MAG: bifunctional hydroxymethylpyrimidine kinase/phosphomethylpyrimidine kinase [Thermodesulfobacteriota bacterium]|nr:bifunctional hydroxymethylpyrimidine kinase/phosphomethylpyrimidine kinase [Thermodesulfobacteriota bacterium]